MVKYCHKCGTELPDDAEFCQKCGAHVSVVTENKEKNNNIKTDGGKEQVNFKENLVSKIVSNKKLFVIIIAVIVVVGSVILFSGILEPNYTMTLDYASKYSHTNDLNETGYGYDVGGYIDPAPEDLSDMGIVTDFYNSYGDKVATTSDGLYVAMSPDGSFTACYGSDHYIDMDYAKVKLYKNGHVIASERIIFDDFVVY